MNAAIVLCGGASRRLGRDKCQARLGREPMIGHVLRAIQSCVADILVVGRELQHPDEVIPTEFRETTKFNRLRSRWWSTRRFSRRLGIASWFHPTGALSGCDTPLITPKLIECLFQMADGYEAAVPWIEEN
jgi:molybdopterin-guanine dinucleotide biosynthesis protein A